MRVIHLMNHCAFANGNVHAAVDLACAQVARGDVVCLASAGGEFEPLLAAHGVTHVHLDQKSRNPVAAVRMIFQLDRLVRRFRPDVLHAHMMTGAVIAAPVSAWTGVPLITTVHNAFERHATLMGVGRLVVGVSQAVAEKMEGRGVPRRKLRAVLNGTLGAPRRDFFGRQPIRLSTPNLVTISAQHDRKGMPDMIHAFEQVAQLRPELQLYVVGDGPGRPAYEALAATTSVADRIHFLGHLRDTKSFLEAADIFLLASHDEPFGLVLTEAREAGCAIIATEVGGIPEALDHGAAGTMVPPHRPDALAAAVSRLLDDPAELARQRQAARANIDRWHVDRMAADYHRVYVEARRAAHPSDGSAGARRPAPPEVTT